MTPKILISGPQGRMENYIRAVLRAGGEPVAAYSPRPDPSCAGLVLGGGGDLDPALYGQENRGSEPPDPVRDRAELELFQFYFQAGRPILGICRGMQVINAALGGALLQDLPPSVRRKHLGRQGRDSIHPVSLAPDGFLAGLYGPALTVNSWHHQAVDRLGRGLVPSAWAPEGFPEALERRDRPVFGVQFHPERMDPAAAGDGSRIFTFWMRQIRRSYG